MDSKELIPAGIAIALMSQRLEVLRMAMQSLRKQALEGTLTGEPLDHVLNALEALCEEVIRSNLERRGFGAEDEDEEGI